jgi:hypothetical protein
MNRLLSWASWTAPAERSGDGAFGRANDSRTRDNHRACESGVALCLPPHSKTLARDFDYDFHHVAAGKSLCDARPHPALSPGEREKSFPRSEQNQQLDLPRHRPIK